MMPTRAISLVPIFALAAMVGVSFAGGNASASRPTFISEDLADPKATLLVYDAAQCDETNGNECLLVSFQCDGRFLVTVENRTDQELARWLGQKDGMSLVVSGKEVSDAANAVSMTKDDMNGTWGVTFRVAGSTLPLADDRMTFDLIDGPLTVPLTEQNKTSLNRLITACP